MRVCRGGGGGGGEGGGGGCKRVCLRVSKQGDNDFAHLKCPLTRLDYDAYLKWDDENDQVMYFTKIFALHKNIGSSHYAPYPIDRLVRKSNASILYLWQGLDKQFKIFRSETFFVWTFYGEIQMPLTVVD